MVYLLKTYFGNIFCEVGIADSPKATLLVCPGLPGIPKEQPLLKRLVQDGFNVLYPRYAGTFESDGSFLQQSPVDDLMGMLEIVEKPFTELYGLTERQIKLGKLIILGSSFGASVGMVLASKIPADGIFIAPVANFETQGDYEGEQSMQEIMGFVKRSNKHTYRFAEGGREKLNDGILIPPLADFDYSNSKVLLFHGKDDSTVNPNQSKNISKKTGIELHELPGGHFPLSSMEYELLVNYINKLV